MLGGGGLYVQAGYDAQVAVRGGRISYNQTTLQDPPENNSNAYGGGVNNGANLTLERVEVSHNRAGQGGGLVNTVAESSLNVLNSAFHNNTAVSLAGGLFLGGSTAMTLTNVTVSGNATGPNGSGGGIVSSENGAVVLQNVTLYTNEAPQGANLYFSNAATTLRNTVLGAPVSGANCYFGGETPLTSGGYNLASDDSCGLTATGDQQNTDPLLGALSDNGGETLTHLPAAGSPVVDSGDDASCPATDQPAATRGPAGAGCDVGAVEVVGDDEPPPPIIPINLVKPLPYLLPNVIPQNPLVDTAAQVLPRSEHPVTQSGCRGDAIGGDARRSRH